MRTYIFSSEILTFLVTADRRFEALYFSEIFQFFEFVFDVCIQNIQIKINLSFNLALTEVVSALDTCVND